MHRILVSALTLSIATACNGDHWVINDVTLIDVEAGVGAPNAAVVVSGNRIVAAGPKTELELPRGATEADRGDEAIAALREAISRGEQSADNIANIFFGNGHRQGVQPQNWRKLRMKCSRLLKPVARPMSWIESELRSSIRRASSRRWVE